MEDIQKSISDNLQSQKEWIENNFMQESDIMKGKAAAIGEVRMYSGKPWVKVSNTGNPNKDWVRQKETPKAAADAPKKEVDTDALKEWEKRRDSLPEGADKELAKKWVEHYGGKNEAKKEEVKEPEFKNLPEKDSPDWNKIKIAKDTVKNPNKALLGGQSLSEAKDILKQYGLLEAVEGKSEEKKEEGKETVSLIALQTKAAAIRHSKGDVFAKKSDFTAEQAQKVIDDFEVEKGRKPKQEPKAEQVKEESPIEKIKQKYLKVEKQKYQDALDEAKMGEKQRLEYQSKGYANSKEYWKKEAYNKAWKRQEKGQRNAEKALAGHSIIKNVMKEFGLTQSVYHGTAIHGYSIPSKGYEFNEYDSNILKFNAVSKANFDAIKEAMVSVGFVLNGSSDPAKSIGGPSNSTIKFKPYFTKEELSK